MNYVLNVLLWWLCTFFTLSLCVATVPCQVELFVVSNSELKCTAVDLVNTTCTLSCDTGFSFHDPLNGESITQTCNSETGMWSRQSGDNYFAKWGDFCTKDANPKSRHATTVVYLEPTPPGTTLCPSEEDINTAMTVLHETHADLFLCLEQEECEQVTADITCEHVESPVSSFKVTLHYKLTADLADYTSMKLLSKAMIYVIEIGEFELDISSVSFKANTDHFNSTVDYTCETGFGKIGEFCVQCPMGYFMDKDTNRCERCPVGSYSDTEGVPNCTPCGEGKTTFQDQSTNLRDCVTSCVVEESDRGTVMPPPQWNVPEGTKISISCDPGHTVPYGLQTLYGCGEEPPHCFAKCELEDLPDEILLIPYDMTRHLLHHGNSTTVMCANRYYYELTCDDGQVNWPDCANTSPHFSLIGNRIYILVAASLILGIMLSVAMVLKQSLRKHIHTKFKEGKRSQQINIENPMDKRIINLPIHKDMFSEKVEKFNETGKKKWKKEFDSIQKFDPEQKKTIAQSAHNRIKNHVKAWNIVPYNISRVKLSEEDNPPLGDYYNASYMNGWSGPREYIVAQTPLHNTAGDFWRIFIDLNCRNMILLHPTIYVDFPDYFKFWPNEEGLYDHVLVRVVPDTSLSYNGFIERYFTVGPVKSTGRSIISGEYDKDGVSEIRSRGTIRSHATERGEHVSEHASFDDKNTGEQPIDNQPIEMFTQTTQTGDSIAPNSSTAGDDEAGEDELDDTQSFPGSEAQSASSIQEILEWDSSFEMKQIIFTEWTEDGKPDMEGFTNMLYYYRSFGKFHKTKAPPVIASEHGSDWAAVFCGTDYILDRMLDEPEINIAGLTNAMRQQRPMMIANVEQYQYFHELVNFILRSDEFEEMRNSGFERSTPKSNGASSISSEIGSTTLIDRIGGIFTGWFTRLTSGSPDSMSLSSMSSQESII